MLEQNVFKKPLIMGLGKTGLSFVKFFKYLNIDEVVVWDQKPTEASLKALKSVYSNAQIYTGALNEVILNKGSGIFLSPGIPRAPIAAIVNRPPIVSEFDVFANYCDTPCVGVTGSNGKSTVVHLLYQMGLALQKEVVLAGNFGVPILDAYLDVIQNNKQIALYILELSSWQLESIDYLHLKAATVLNITRDHLDRYRDFSHYAATKNTIYDHASFGLYNADQQHLWPKKLLDKHQTFSSHPDHKNADFYYNEHQQELYYLQKPIANMTYWYKKGKFYAENVMAALAIGLNQGWDLTVMLQVASAYIGLRHRCQWVSTINEVAWYNDSKGTNVDAVIAALKGVGAHENNIIWIAGGKSKDADFTELKPIVKKHVKEAVLLGVDADKIAKVIVDDIPVHQVLSLEAAVTMANQIAKPGDVVLLSPACTSFDMFKNFEERGDVFIKHVQALKELV